MERVVVVFDGYAHNMFIFLTTKHSRHVNLVVFLMCLYVDRTLQALRVFKGSFNVLMFIMLQQDISNGHNLSVRENWRVSRQVTSKIQSLPFSVMLTKFISFFCLHFECLKENTRFRPKMNLANVRNRYFMFKIIIRQKHQLNFFTQILNQ